MVRQNLRIERASCVQRLEDSCLCATKTKNVRRYTHNIRRDKQSNEESVNSAAEARQGGRVADESSAHPSQRTDTLPIASTLNGKHVPTKTERDLLESILAKTLSGRTLQKTNDPEIDIDFRVIDVSSALKVS